MVPKEELSIIVLNTIQDNIDIAKELQPLKNPFPYINTWINYLYGKQGNVDKRTLSSCIKEEVLYNHLGNLRSENPEESPINTFDLIVGGVAFMALLGGNVVPLIVSIPYFAIKFIGQSYVDNLNKKTINLEQKLIESLDFEPVIDKIAPVAKLLLDKYQKYQNETFSQGSGSPSVSGK